jgi:hypothetical protein
VQLEGVAVHTFPGPGEGRPDAFHPLLEPAAAPLEDAQPHVGSRLAEEREVHPEPVVLPGRGARLAEEFGQPLLAVGGQPVHLQRPAPGPGPGRAVQPGRAIRPGVGGGGLVMVFRDQPRGEKLVQARVQRAVGQRAEQAQHAGYLLAQLVAVHRCHVQQPEHGQLEHRGPVTPHAALQPAWLWSGVRSGYPAVHQPDASVR